MENILDLAQLTDVPMIKPLPTQRNRRVGEAALATRLDRFVIKNQLLQRLTHYRQWFGSGGISDHPPIYLEVSSPPIKPRAPFKFNSVWLQDPSYIELVTNHWAQNPPSQYHSRAKGFYQNFLQLKKLTIKWAKEKHQKDNQNLTFVEAALTDFTADNNRGFLSVEDKSHLIDMENKRIKILKDWEETWRLKSQAIWLKAGDDYTKYFQNLAKGRKASNTIWHLPTPEGGSSQTFHQLSQLGTTHFQKLFKEPPGYNLAEIIQVAGHFPRFVNQETADEITTPITREELEETLKWFQKEKSPRRDGWPI